MKAQISFLVVLLGALGFCSPDLNAAVARPNILFAIADDMGHAGAYGTRWVKTPNFDRLAERGILFLNAYTPDAKCSPSRACIFTGRNPWQLEAAANHIPYYPAKFKSWMEALNEGGYFVGSTGKTWAPGVLPPERHQLAGKSYGKRKLQPPTPAISDVDYAGNFEDFLADCPKGQPFCFWFGCHEPHRKYQFGSGVAKGGYKLEETQPVPSYWPDEASVRNDMLDYAFEIAHFDPHLGKMIEFLAAKDLLDNTIIVATSDNGCPFPRVKGHPYEASCHLPMAVQWPKGIVAPGRKTDALVSFIDFAPTFLELAGVKGEGQGMQAITGKSFCDILANAKSTADRSVLLMGRERNDVLCRPGTPAGLGYPVRAMRQGSFFYLHNFESDRWPCGNPELGLKDTDDGPTKTAVENKGEDSRVWQLCFGKRPADELYDLKTDPDCVKNLATDPAYKGKIEQMRQALKERLRGEHDPRVLGKGEVFDRYPSPKAEAEKSNSPTPKKAKANRKR